MHLKAIELYGFKSFAREVRIDLPPGLTALVGPNGGGKSNVVDAIRWALGEQRVRELRAERWEELLWNGSSGRRPAQLAEVTLEFDNTDGAMPGWPEVLRVGRRLYRQGDSEYLVANRAVRLRDLTDLFLDSGLGRAAYAVIGQGRIEATLLQRPSDRLQQVEEAAGNTRVQLRERETRQRLESVARDVVRAKDLARGVRREMGELAAEAEHERQYMALAAQADALRAGLKAARRARLERQVQRLAAQRTAGGQRQDALAAQMAEAAAARQEAAAEVSAAEARVARLTRRSVECEQARQRWQGRLDSLRTEQAQIAGWVAEAQHDEGAPPPADRPATSGDEDRLRAVASALDAAERAHRHAEAERDRRAETYHALAAERDRLAAASAAQQRARDRLAGILGPDAARPAEAVAALKAEVADLAARVAAADGAQRDRAQQVDRLTQYLATERERLAAQERQVAQRQARHRVLHQLEAEGEGYAQGVRAILQAAQQGALSGILGTLGTLVEVPDPYRVAIHAALGGAAQDVVVATDHDARDAVRHLQARGLGRATFLPLNTVRPSRPNAGDDDIVRHEGVRGWALDLVAIADALRPAASHRLGRVVVVERLEDAMALGRLVGFRYRLVTLDGQLVHPGGAITGGSPGQPTAPWTRRAEIARLADQLAAERPQLEGLRELVASVESEAREAAMALAEIQRQRHALALEHQHAAARLAAALAAWSPDEPEEVDAPVRLLAAQEAAADAESQWRAAVEACQQLQGERAALQAECRRWEALADERRQEAARWAAVWARAAEQRAAAERRAAALALRARTVAADMDDAEGHVAALDRELAELTQQVADARQVTEALRQQIQAADHRIAALRLEHTRLAQRAQQWAVEEERAGGQLEELSADREAQGSPVPDVGEAERQLNTVTRQIEELGTIRPGSLAAHQALEERARFLEAEQGDVERAARDLEATLADLAGEAEGRRRQALQQLESAFATAVAEMFGGGRGGFRSVSSPEPGIDLWVEPPGKRPQSLALLSGGEKALGALAWLFALLDVRPAPLVVLDEAEASLDEENARRFALYLARRRHSQYVVVTHHKSTMEQAAALWGFTTDGSGASRLVSVRLGTDSAAAEVG